MNINFLIQNIKSTKSFFPKISDRIKYVGFIYGLLKKEIELLIKFRYGLLKVRVRNNNGSDAFILGEVLKQNCYDISNFTGIDCKTIVDLGANCGYTSLYLSMKYPNAEVVAVEPVPNNTNQIETHIRINKLERVRLFPNAIGATDGTAYIHYIDKDYGHQITDIPNNNPISVVSIPTIMKEMNWNEIDFLKIDIEGYEEVLLKQNTQWLEKVNNIVIEIHENYTSEDLDELAKKYDFLPPQDISGNYFLTKNK